MYYPAGNARISERACSWITPNGWALDQRDLGDRTSGKQGSDEPLRRAAVRTGYRGNTPPATYGSKVRDRSKDDQYCCKTRPDISGYRTGRRTYQWTLADDLAEHGRQLRTHKTTRLVLLALVPTSKFSLVVRDKRISDQASNQQKFLNRICPNQPSDISPSPVKIGLPNKRHVHH